MMPVPQADPIIGKTDPPGSKTLPLSLKSIPETEQR